MEHLLRRSDELIAQIKTVVAMRDADVKQDPASAASEGTEQGALSAMKTTAGDEEVKVEILQIKQQVALMFKTLSVFQQQLETLFELFRDTIDKEVHLTAREEQVLILLKQGYNNKDMAVALNLGVQTVKNHVHGLFDKLGVKNRAQMLQAARKIHIEPDPPAGPVSQ